jgi:exodeoxyribonuclease VII small subunit
MAEAINASGVSTPAGGGVSTGGGGGGTVAGAAGGSVAGPGAQDLGFDQILGRLREVVMRLESGELSLEQSLLIYEEGVQLARRGQHLLASAERRVEILVSASGGLEIAPFDEPGPG